MTQVQKNTPLLGNILTGDRSIFVKQEGVNVMKMYKCAKKSSPLYVPQTRECYDKIPILYKNRVQYVLQLTRQTYLWAKKVPCSHSNFDQLISIDTEETARYRVTPYPVKVETILNTISPEEIVLDNMFSKASLIESGIYSKEQLIQKKTKFYKQASITKILLTGIFGIFSQTLTQLVAQIQEEEENSHDSDENYTHYGYHKSRKKHTFRRHSTDITHTTDYTDNDKPAEIYVDTNYNYYNTTVRRTEKGLQLRTTNSPQKKQKPPLPERKYKQEPLRVEPMETISENKLQTLPPQLITPPPAYQCSGNNVSFPNTPLTHNAHLPSVPNIQQQPTSFQTHSYEPPLNMNQSTSSEIPQPSNKSTNKQRLIPTVKLMDIQNPPPIDFDQLKITANKMHNRSHSLDILKNDDQPHTNEVTYFKNHSADTYEV